jgi:inosine-uridine nucleoside N-ribohydrolase
MGSAGGDPEDSFAILLALHSPELTVEGLTIVQGNVPVDHGYANACHLLQLLGRGDVPVFAGYAQPLSSERTAQIAWLKQRGKLERLVPALAPPKGAPHAVDFLTEKVAENPGDITLVTIGPLTNVAAALDGEPSLAEKIPRIVMMGGAAIDVCEQTHLHRDTVEALASGSTALARFVAHAVRPWLALRRAIYGASDLHLYDSLAVAVTFLPELVRTREAFVAVETDGTHTAGATVTYLNPVLRAALAAREPNANVALEVQGTRFEALFAERVIEPLLAGSR